MQRLLLALVLVFLFQEAFAQSKNVYGVSKEKISVTYVNAGLREIISDLQKRYDINFSYTEDVLSPAYKKSISCSQQPLESVLNSLFKDTPIQYHFVGSQVVLTKKKMSYYASEKKPLPLDTGHRSGSFKALNLKKDSVTTAKQVTLKRSFYFLRSRPDTRNKKTAIVSKGSGRIIQERRKRGPVSAQRGKQLHRNQLQTDSTQLSSGAADGSLMKDSLSINNQRQKSQESSDYPKKSARPIFNNSRSRFSMELVFFGGQSFRTLRANNEDGKALVSKRDGERAKFSYGASLCVRYEFHKGFLGYTGLRLWNLGQKGKIESGQEYVNSYHYLTMPLGIGYKIGTKKSLTLLTHLAPSLRLNQEKSIDYYKYGGYYENLRRWPYSRLVYTPPPLNYRRFNLGYYIGLQAAQKCRNWDIFIRISYSRFLLSLYERSASLNEKNYAFGLNAGFVYYFQAKKF